MRGMALWLAPVVALSGMGAAGAGILEDITSGKLIRPEVGVYAWYELTDTASNSKIYLRQAVVGEEKVKRKTGYWIETEIIPQVGFPAVYKMLLTGPANEKGNIHQVLMREGEQPPQPVPVDPEAEIPAPEAQERQSIGMEKVSTAAGELEAEHVTLAQGGKKIDVWLNDTVRPLGIVKMVTPEGELILQRHGQGGPDGESRIMPTAAGAQAPGESEVQVRVEAERVPAPAKEGATPAEAGEGDSAAPAAGSPAPPPAEAAAPAGPKKNFSGRKSGQ